MWAERTKRGSIEGCGLLGVVCGGAAGSGGRGRRLRPLRRHRGRQHLPHHPTERSGHESVRSALPQYLPRTSILRHDTCYGFFCNKLQSPVAFIEGEKHYLSNASSSHPAATQLEMPAWSIPSSCLQVSYRDTEAFSIGRGVHDGIVGAGEASTGSKGSLFNSQCH